MRPPGTNQVPRAGRFTLRPMSRRRCASRTSKSNDTSGACRTIRSKVSRGSTSPPAALVLAFLVQEALQPLRPGRMAELPQRLGLDLADAPPRDVELLADFLKRMVSGHLDAEAHAQHLGLARGQGIEHLFGDI